jgi:hypothetical protein
MRIVTEAISPQIACENSREPTAPGNVAECRVALREPLARISHHAGDWPTVCHCLAQAVPSVTRGPGTACSKQWHTR